MNKKIIFKIINKYSYFFWLIILIFLTVFITYFHNLNKKSQINYLNKSLKNTYLSNSIKKLTSELKPRYINIEYNVKQGDTYESIINNISIPQIEKKIFLNTVTKNKNINILKLNQKIFFKIDKKNKVKIVKFIIEIDKKKNILFEKSNDDKTYIAKIIEKNLIRTVTFREGIIKTVSLTFLEIFVGIIFFKNNITSFCLSYPLLTIVQNPATLTKTIETKIKNKYFFINNNYFLL